MLSSSLDDRDGRRTPSPSSKTPPMTYRVSLRLASIAMIAFAALFGRAGAAETEWDLNRVLEGLCRKHDVPSLTVGVTRSDKVIEVGCAGVRKQGADDEVALSDRHPLGSCTKSMTATLAAVLVESGDIAWDTTIAEVWPRATAKHLRESLRDVTLGELLSHQSGITTDLSGPDWVSFFEEEATPPAERRRMLRLVLNVKPEHPRGEHNYSNLGYVVAAAMLEARTGKTYEGMMRRLVFKPLGMKSAKFRTMATASNLREPLLWGHRDNGEPIDPRIAGAENPSVYASCGTVNITVSDYLRYARWHLGDDPAPVLKTRPALEYLHTGQVDSPSTGGRYGAGWICVDTPFGPALTHGGSNTNSFALIWLLPERDFAAVALANTGADSGFLACDEAIRDLMLRYARR